MASVLGKALDLGQSAKDAIGVENDSLCPTVSWSIRLKGFIGCIVFGILVSLLGWISLWLNDDLIMFLVLSTIGNLTSLCSSFFLTGPMKQLGKMFEKKRIVATIVMFTFIVLTIVAAIILPGPLGVLVVLILYIGQWIAMAWYCISYIPYARSVMFP